MSRWLVGTTETNGVATNSLTLTLTQQNGETHYILYFLAIPNSKKY
jgi:hypothetical protein